MRRSALFAASFDVCAVSVPLPVAAPVPAAAAAVAVAVAAGGSLPDDACQNALALAIYANEANEKMPLLHASAMNPLCLILRVSVCV